MRELVWMARGKLDHDDRLMWNHTSNLMWMVYAVNVTDKGNRKGPEFFNPYTKAKSSDGMKLDKDSIQLLKQLARKGRGLNRA